MRLFVGSEDKPVSCEFCPLWMESVGCVLRTCGLHSATDESLGCPLSVFPTSEGSPVTGSVTGIPVSCFFLPQVESGSSYVAWELNLGNYGVLHGNCPCCGRKSSVSELWKRGRCPSCATRFSGLYFPDGGCEISFSSVVYNCLRLNPSDEWRMVGYRVVGFTVKGSPMRPHLFVQVEPVLGENGEVPYFAPFREFPIELWGCFFFPSKEDALRYLNGTKEVYCCFYPGLYAWSDVLLDIKLADCSDYFPARVISVLRITDILTFRDLLFWSEEDLLMLRNFGKHCMDALRAGIQRFYEDRMLGDSFD